MEPRTQVEIQLGHMCNNRCVFCVSGQETALGRARPLETAPILEQVSAAYASGHRKITLLGGEPTLQPGFLDVVKHAVALGFEEVVIFTNGVKTARAAVIDEILATGGKFTWRISLQGATEASHERTTLKDGSFARIVRTLEHLRERGEPITVNMCVVRSNHEDVDRFPELLLPFGARQLHLDMIRPLDAGVRTEDEMRAMLPRYSDMAPALRRMVAGFPEGFDVNIGNLPYCIAPDLSPWIHHDGERTMTIAVEGDASLSKPWDKYLVKRRDKSKPPGCARCLFDGRCSGVFEMYRETYGVDELVPIDAETLRRADPARRLASVHLRGLLAKLRGLALPSPFTGVSATEIGELEVVVTLDAPDPLVVSLRRAEGSAPSLARYGWVAADVTRAPRDREAAARGLAAFAAALEAALAAEGERVVAPLGDDAVVPVARSIGARLARLRRHAPFGALAWRSTRVAPGGRRAECELVGPAEERAFVFLAEDDAGNPSGGYRLVEGEKPTDALVQGLRELMGALRGQPKPAATATP